MYSALGILKYQPNFELLLVFLTVSSVLKLLPASHIQLFEYNVTYSDN